MSDTCDQLESCELPCPAEWEPKADLVEVYGVSAGVADFGLEVLPSHSSSTEA